MERNFIYALMHFDTINLLLIHLLEDIWQIDVWITMKCYAHGTFLPGRKVKKPKDQIYVSSQNYIISFVWTRNKLISTDTGSSEMLFFVYHYITLVYIEAAILMPLDSSIQVDYLHLNRYFSIVDSGNTKNGLYQICIKDNNNSIIFS